jgi:hypothetical protein
LICRRISVGLYPCEKTTVPAIIGGTNVAIDWPNMWLSGSRFRNRIGWKGRMYLRYFAISRSMGTVFARMLRCVIVTPFGSAVAPLVKIISASDVGSGVPGSGFRVRLSGSGFSSTRLELP